MTGVLWVVGALHRDVVVRAPRFPALDETLKGSAVAYRLGGKAGNQALAAARTGARVAFAGRIGADEAGASMRSELERAGVDMGGLQRGDGASGMSVALVEEGGGYRAVIVSGENAAIDTAKLSPPTGTALLLLQNEVSAAVNLTAAKAAKAAGAWVAMNAAPAAEVDPTLLALVDTLIVNRVEAAQLLGREAEALDAVDAALGLAGLVGGAEAIVTLGGEGVVLARGGAAEARPAERVAVRSTHGAGDAFAGAWAAARLAGAATGEAVAAGQAAAAALISDPARV